MFSATSLLSIPAEEKIVICASRIYNKETIKYLRRFCYMYNADFSPEWTDSVTHLIVSCEAKSDRLCRKTLKFLQALIAEKWVLSEFWIVQSVNKGKLLPPFILEIYIRYGIVTLDKLYENKMKLLDCTLAG
ncbi:Breast cancer type 1 susceptibility -like protein [Trichinella patagoniensis]|uniref:Breast cancer type 1 susceptibility-like protein n=1 Tax=Trichinella patagoniensis TaxID=990121 RepID=A0A0V0ZV73_9BILA|nr:Breast cancer type 1 susceptibility -like protein [Trichinella patagoniensis]